jgi:hypothetical protein
MTPKFLGKPGKVQMPDGAEECFALVNVAIDIAGMDVATMVAWRDQLRAAPGNQECKVLQGMAAGRAWLQYQLKIVDRATAALEATGWRESVLHLVKNEQN